jgi:hypothetical protein
VSNLPPRPKPAYFPGCSVCEQRRTHDGGIACMEHRSADEWAWFAEVELIAAAPRAHDTDPTLF